MASGTSKTSGSASGRFVGDNGLSPVYGEEPAEPAFALELSGRLRPGFRLLPFPFGD